MRISPFVPRDGWSAPTENGPRPISRSRSAFARRLVHETANEKSEHEPGRFRDHRDFDDPSVERRLVLRSRERELNFGPLRLHCDRPSALVRRHSFSPHGASDDGWWRGPPKRTTIELIEPDLHAPTSDVSLRPRTDRHAPGWISFSSNSIHSVPRSTLSSFENEDETTRSGHPKHQEPAIDHTIRRDLYELRNV